MPSRPSPTTRTAQRRSRARSRSPRNGPRPLRRPPLPRMHRRTAGCVSPAPWRALGSNVAAGARDTRAAAREDEWHERRRRTARRCATGRGRLWYTYAGRWGSMELIAKTDTVAAHIAKGHFPQRAPGRIARRSRYSFICCPALCARVRAQHPLGLELPATRMIAARGEAARCPTNAARTGRLLAHSMRCSTTAVCVRTSVLPRTPQALCARAAL